MEKQYVNFRQSRLHYYRYGDGAHWVFCFHGYGEDGLSFSHLAQTLDKSHTLIAMEMPFHGQTVWSESLFFDPKELAKIITSMLGPTQTISLVGYSMGGRICLHLLELIPERIQQLVLIAPDGLHKNRWQRFATKTILGNRLFKLTMQYPGWMFALMAVATQLGLFNQSIHKFVHHYLDHASERHLLYQRWTTMRGFSPNLQAIRSIVSEQETKLQLLFGSYDRVILAVHGQTLAKGLEQLIRVTTIAAGHQLLREKHTPIIANMLLEP